MREPQREAQSGMPGRVTIYEVGPRDGLQNEKTVVPVEVKAEFVRRLVSAGLDTVETTSFVSPEWVPQLADSAALLTLLGEVGRGRNRPVLVPNDRGLDAALAQGVQAVAIFGSATETFARKNLNRSVDESIAMFAPVVARARAEGLWVRAYVSMCFGDPWEGDVPIDQVVAVASRMMDLGCDQLSLGDTIGTGTTGHVHRRNWRRAHWGAFPRHLRSSPRQHLGCAGTRSHRRRRLVRWSGRVSLCEERDRQPGDGGPRLGARRAGDRDRDRPRGVGGHQCLDGRAPWSAVAVAGCQGAGRWR